MPRKFNGGEPFKVNHQDHNRWQDAGLAYAMNRFGGQQGVTEPDWAGDGIIMVKNNTNRDLPRYSILTVTDTIPNPRYSTEQLNSFKNFVQLKGEEPTSEITGRFCVLQVNARRGQVVPAMISGTTPCLLKVSAETDEFCDVETEEEDDNGNSIDRTRYLKTSSSGSAQVIFKPENETGEQWGVVRLGNRSSGTWKSGLVTSLDPDLYTVGSSGSHQVFEFNNIFPTSGVPFEFDSDNYLHFTEAVDPCFFFVEIYMSIPYQQNNWCSLETRMQGYSPQTGTWTSTGGYCTLQAAWPNVATLGGSGANSTLNQLIMRGSTVEKDAKFRIRTTATYSGSAPQVRVNCSAFRIFYQ